MINQTIRRFMRALVSLFMALWLLAVTVGGWCCHAPHACAATVSRPSALIVCAPAGNSIGCVCHECKHRSTNKPSPAAPCKCPHGCIGFCKTLPKPRSASEFQLPSTPLQIAAVAIPAIDLHGAAAFRFAGSKSLADCGPALRLHLLNQILIV
jgi:hypothetical protein